MTQSRILVAGSLHLDIIVTSDRLPMLGETLAGSASLTKCGGKGANQAVEAARHGGAVAMAGCVGADAFGDRLRAHLAEAGVDVTHLATTAGASGMSVVVSERSGDYAAVIVSGANQELAPEQVEAACRLLPAGGVLVLQNEVPETANRAAAAAARGKGALVILNAAPARPLDAGLAGLVDILVVNAIEAEMLGACHVASLADATGAARHLCGVVRSVIVTAGGAGVAFSGPGGTGALPPHRITPVSTHGAGDAFIGALAARLAGGAPFSQAVAYANAAAAMIVATPEAQRRGLGPADTETLLRQELPAGC